MLNNIIKEFKLEKHYLNILKNNKSNCLPYHGLRHIETVVVNSYYIYMEYYFNLYKTTKLNNFYYDNCKTLLIAALYHDFNHSGGKLTDDKNIELALEEVSKLTDCDVQLVSNLIKITQYPYIEENINYLQAMLRDADLSQICSDDYIHFLLGLNNESNSNISLNQLIKNSIEFNENHKFITDEAAYIFNERKNINIIKLKELLNEIK